MEIGGAGDIIYVHSEGQSAVNDDTKKLTYFLICQYITDKKQKKKHFSTKFPQFTV